MKYLDEEFKQAKHLSCTICGAQDTEYNDVTLYNNLFDNNNFYCSDCLDDALRDMTTTEKVEWLGGVVVG